MIPGLATWNYVRNDVVKPASVGIAVAFELATENININSWIPEGIDEYMMFLLFIVPKFNGRDLVCSIIKTNENTDPNEFIMKGSYYAYYIIPSKKFDIVTSGLHIFDLNDESKSIFIDYPIIFSDLYFCKTELLLNTFIVN